MNNNTIFVALTAYRDKELVPTVLSLLYNTKIPVKIGVIWQGNPEDDYILEELPDCNLKKYLARECKGAGWARSLVRELWSGEEWFLQIDSHSRMVPDWGEKMISWWTRCEDEKAVLSSYPDCYNPYTNNYQICHAYGIRPIQFKDNHIWHLEQRAVHLTLEKLHKGYLVSGGFIFGKGELALLGYDPKIYFTGEEIAYALRLYTNGYNVYHPGENLIYHFYGRDNEPRHWKDFPQDYGKYAIESFDRFEKIIKSGAGLGTQRSIQQFTLETGIDFTNLTVTCDSHVSC